MNKKLLLLSVALIAFAPAAFATDDNSAAISGSNNSLVQQTGTGNVLATGSGAFGTTNTGGAGGNATANGGTGGSVIGSGNSSNVNTALGGTGGQGGTGGTGIGLGGVGLGGSSSATGGNQSQSATTGNQSINVEAQKRNPVASAAPAFLTAADDTCMGSSSAGGQGVGFGFSLGSTWTDGDCVRRKDARELHNMGLKPAAIALMCQNEQVRAAMATAGTPCVGLAAVASSAPEWRDRSGYPASGNSSKH